MGLYFELSAGIYCKTGQDFLNTLTTSDIYGRHSDVPWNSLKNHEMNQTTYNKIEFTETNNL